MRDDFICNVKQTTYEYLMGQTLQENEGVQLHSYVYKRVNTYLNVHLNETDGSTMLK